ncbi:MAG: hypothetical protein LPH21_06365 [Shewanella sp.]|nr:hypothetical protein [Shewanella sp.]
MKFVLYTFPWGKRGTPLAKYKKPRQWQIDELRRIRDHLAHTTDKSEVYYCSIGSGRGPGKTALIAMLNYWVASCWWGGTCIVTANTETQLRTRTMAELGKWHAMALNRHWFTKSALSLKPAKWFADELMKQQSISSDLYYVQGQIWNEENPDAFAGAHSTVAMVLCMDEAAGIPDTIWNVSEGFFTDLAGLRIWLNISNPRRPTGRFFDCFHSDRERWHTRTIDSREVEGLDPAVYQRIADKFGEDHDVTRVEVRGLFPRTGDDQFISRVVIDDAVVRELEEDINEPLLMGVDVARFGEDETVIRWRQGRNARFAAERYRQLDLMQLSDRVAAAIRRTRPDAVFVDGVGVGGGVVDRLRQLRFKIVEVQGGERPMDTIHYLNCRVELWAKMREWLENAGLPNDETLVLDLANPCFDYDDKGRIRLEKKKDMKARGVNSPNDADALSLTFARRVARRDVDSIYQEEEYHRAETEYYEFGT